MKLERNNHSVYLMYYHLVLVVKYRRKIITDNISNRLQELFVSIGKSYDVIVVEWNSDKDHVHVLFTASPKTELIKLIDVFKSASSRHIKTEYPFVKRYLWKEMFWSRSYCILTTGGATIDVIKKYIESQGEKL